ncbi:flavodoxin domain-containing protein [Chitinophaga parva]|nr:flavodoxin domain-containing protein [Chitinophaga parva]
MKGIIIYRSKYGATSQYAAWLSAALNIPAVAQQQLSRDQLASAGYVILGSPIYMGKLLMRKWLQRQEAALAGKQLFLYLVTATKPDKVEKLQGYIRLNVPPGIRSNCRCFFFPGKIIYRQLSLADKMKVKTGSLLARLMHKKLDVSEFNNVDEAHIQELVQDIARFTGASGGKFMIQAS